MVAMDEYSYHLFKSYLINNVMHRDDSGPYMIIATHNFSYLYIQLSNIITNEDFIHQSKVLKLYPDKIRELDIKLFKYDDLALFKKALSCIKYSQQLLNLSCLYIKIFRELLDLKLRLSGMPLNGNPSPEIQLLPISDENKRTLKQKHEIITSCSKNPNIDLNKSKKGLLALYDAIKILGFEEYLFDIEINKILAIENNNVEYIRDDIDVIIEELSYVLRSGDFDQKYKDYINHPRISFTKNALATSMNI